MESCAGSLVASFWSPPAARQVVAFASLRVMVTFATEPLAAAFAGSFARQVTTENCARRPDWTLHVAAGRERAPDLGFFDLRGEMQFAASPDAYVLWMGRHAPTLYVVDVPNRRALYWTEAEDLIPAWERSRPFLPIIQTMLDASPWIAVHAAALVRDGRAVMFTGPGRAGKTSLALAGLRARWGFVGDDYILLRTDHQPAVASLYRTARLRDDMLPRFDDLLSARREISDEDDDRRHEMVLGRADGIVGVGETPLSAMLLLSRCGSREPVFGPAGRAALLSTLVANMAVATPGLASSRSIKLFRLLQHVAPKSFDPGPTFDRALEALARVLG